jgi:hypothetical protein
MLALIDLRSQIAGGRGQPMFLDIRNALRLLQRPQRDLAPP